jgi:phosphoribosylanthranilate isomerase
MPSGPGIISEALIAEITRIIPPPIATFLLTSKTDVEEIVEQQKHCRVNTIQIVDRLKKGTHRDLKEQLNGISIVQVVHIEGKESVEEAIKQSRHVDALLLDSGNTNMVVKKLGGTGKTHNWELSRKIREKVKIPIFLAGGLTAENVTQAIAEVGPFAIDLCTGVRTDGKLDEKKL